MDLRQVRRLFISAPEEYMASTEPPKFRQNCSDVIVGFLVNFPNFLAFFIISQLFIKLQA